ncbi:hypothetical protein B0H19DRAFT_1272011 [Mycena capillaripes]|nr:hypothetical protein B0H19DRAFT_1272011 [Mycena capillaripes]
MNWGLSCELVLEFAYREGRVLRVVVWGTLPAIFPTILALLTQVNQEKLYAVVPAGNTLTDLHVQLGRQRRLELGPDARRDRYNEPRLGMTYPAPCPPQEHTDLYLATSCGPGATGIILTVQLEVECVFWLKDVQCSHTFEDVVEHLDKLVRSAQYVRFWWIAATHAARAQTAADVVVLALAARVPRRPVPPLRGPVLRLWQHPHLRLPLPDPPWA